MANPNIVNTSSILGETEGKVLSTTKQIIAENTANSNRVLKVNTLMISNRDTAYSLRVDAFFRRAGFDYVIAKGLPIPPNATVVLISKDNSIYLREGDAVVAAGEEAAVNNCHAICSYEVIT